MVPRKRQLMKRLPEECADGEGAFSRCTMGKEEENAPRKKGKANQPLHGGEKCGNVSQGEAVFIAYWPFLRSFSCYTPATASAND